MPKKKKSKGKQVNPPGLYTADQVGDKKKKSKKKAGRPKGSKNKPKPDTAGVDRPQATHFTVPIEGGRADKGKKRGPHKEKEPPIPVNPLPPVTSQTTSATRERTQHQAGGIRARGQTLAGAFTPQAPVGGWSGIDPSVDLDWQSSMTSGGLTKSSEIKEEISEMNKKYQIKVDRLDHEDTNPKDWKEARIDSLIMDREIAKRDVDNFGEEQAQNWWKQKREQEKKVIREQERKHHILIHGKDREGVIKDLDDIQGKIVELEKEQAREEGRAYEGGGRVGPEKRAELIIKGDMSLAEQLKHVDPSTTEGKTQALMLIDTASKSALSAWSDAQPIELGEEEVITSRTPSVAHTTRYLPIGEQTLLEGQTLKPQEGLTDTQRLFGTYAYGAVAGLGSAGIALGAVAPSLIKSVAEGYKNVKEKEREKARVKEVIQKSQENIRDIERQKEERKIAGIRKTQEIGKERVKATLEREKELRQAKRVGKELKGDIIKGAFRKIDFPEDKDKDVAEELKKDILAGAFEKITFPAEARKEEKQLEVGRINRRRQGHEIFGSFGNLETPTEEKVRKQREKEHQEWEEKEAKRIRDKSHNQYLKDQSKSIHERLREEERKSAHQRLTRRTPEPEPEPELELSAEAREAYDRKLGKYKSQKIVDDIMEGKKEKTISFVPTKRTPTEPEPVEEEEEYHTAEELTEEETDTEDWESESALEVEPPSSRLQRRPPVGLFAGEQPKPVLKLKGGKTLKLKQKPVLKLKGGKTLKLTPKTEEEFVMERGPPPQPPPAPAFPQTPSALQPDEDTPQPPFRSEPPQPLPRGEVLKVPQTQVRYGRGSTERYLGDEAEAYIKDKDRLREIKGYLHNNGFRSALVDTRSKSDRMLKDTQIAQKLSGMRESGEYEKIKKAIKEAIQLSKRIGKAQQKAHQQKKKKK